MVLKMYRAEAVDDTHSSGAVRRYAAMVRDLAANAGLPQPKVYIIDNPQPNAFATGRNPENAAVAATTGLLRILNEKELAGVMAHELAHVKNRDTLTMTVTATIAGAITMLANFALFFGGNRNNGGGIIGAIAIMIFAPMARQDFQRRRADPERDRRAAARNRSADDHQPAFRPRRRQSFLHPPGDAKPHRAADGNVGRRRASRSGRAVAV